MFGGTKDFVMSLFLAVPCKTLGGGAQGFNVPNCATTAESHAVLLLFSTPMEISSFHIGRMEMVPAFPNSVDNTLDGHLAETVFV